LDADDRMALINLQLQSFGWADAVYSPDIDHHLKLNIFAQSPMQMAFTHKLVAPASSERFEAELQDRAASGERMEALLQSGDESLFYEVGLRTRLAAVRPETAASLRIDGAESGLAEFSFSDLRVLGSGLYNRVLGMVLPIVCGEADADRFIRDEMKAAVGGITGVSLKTDAALELSRVLVARLGIIPVVAQPLAALLISRVFKGGIEGACANWRAQATGVIAPAPSAPSAGMSAPTSREAAMRHVESLLGATDDELLQEIGLRAGLAALAPETAADVQVSHRETVTAEFGLSTLRSLGSGLFGNVQALVLPIVCGDRAEDQQVRDEINAAIGQATGTGKTDATLALAKILVARLGLLPAVAQPLAALLLTRVFAGSVEQACAKWREGGPGPSAPAAARVSAPPVGGQQPGLSVLSVSVPSSPSTAAAPSAAAPSAPTTAGPLAAAASMTTAAAATAAMISASSADAAALASHPDSASSLDDLAVRAPPEIDQAAIERLLNAPESQVFAEIGGEWRAQESLRTGERLEAVPEGMLSALGMSVFSSIERNAYEVVCGDTTTNSEVRQNLWELLGAATSLGNRKDAVSALASLLVTSLGVVPAVAVPIAVIILSRIFSAGLSSACVNWKQRLTAGVPLG
jgi:hypothetical protein